MNNIKFLDGSVVFWVIEVEIFVVVNLFNVDMFVKKYCEGEFEW